VGLRLKKGKEEKKKKVTPTETPKKGTDLKKGKEMTLHFE